MDKTIEMLDEIHHRVMITYDSEDIRMACGVQDHEVMAKLCRYIELLGYRLGGLVTEHKINALTAKIADLQKKIKNTTREKTINIKTDE
jgi:hypothetical protein